MSEQQAVETDRRIQFWARLSGSAFLGVTAAAAAVLGLGAAPAWIEMTAAGYLWAVGLLFLSGFGLVFVSELQVRAIEQDPHPDPRLRQSLDQLREVRERQVRQAQREPKPRPWWRPVAYANRLAYVVFVAALVVSGRPVLAGLYILLVVTGIAAVVHMKRPTLGTGRSDVGVFP